MESSNKQRKRVSSDIHSESIDIPEQSIYYAVHIPPDVQPDVDPYRNIFKDKFEALCTAKTYKKARFKAFLFYHEAVEFATNGQGNPEAAQDSNSHNKETTQVGEKPVAFRGPKSQDLVKLRKAIENGALKVVETEIWENPRYLISSGDTPSILQEGSRYNALHVAARCKDPSMCELILNTVSNVSFVTLLYGDDDNQDLYERSKILLDLYLNTPDKGLNETPLHFAVKFGAVEVVELLVSYPQCDKNVRNKFGKLPNQMICERCEGVSTKIKSKIAMLLEDAFYVPVLRSEHNCTPPVIGEPFASTNPPIFNEDPIQPRIDIHAYAGPMNKETALKFRKVWKTPPRLMKQRLHCKDLEKGLERIGRDLATKHEVGWKEYWAFLDDFVDISSSEGLQQFDKYLASRVMPLSDDTCTNTNSSLGSNILSPISDLCKDFEACRLSDNSYKRQTQPTKQRKTDKSTSCNLIPHQLFDSDVNPSLCIEKTCEVFAHRISNDILNLLESDYSTATSESLQIDITQLQNVMVSFMADNRFNKVDFRKIHHRVGCLVVSGLKDFILLEDEISFMIKTLESWLEMWGKEFDYFSSDEECGNYRQDILNHSNKKCTPKSKQVICLLQHILNAFIFKETPNAQNECGAIKDWNKGKSCDCVWPKPLLSKRSIYKSRILSKSQEDGVNRRLFVNDLDLGSPNSKNDCDILGSRSAGCKNRNISTEGSESDGSEPDDYHTALNSPSLDSSGSDSEDEFQDSVMLEEDIFIEGSVPTKMDYAAFNAVSCAKEKLNPQDYPNVYKWYHAVSLYPESERQSWGSSSVGRCRIGIQGFSTSTPTRNYKSYSEIHHSPISPWLRRIGLPSANYRVSKPNNSFNL